MSLEGWSGDSRTHLHWGNMHHDNIGWVAPEGFHPEHFQTTVVAQQDGAEQDGGNSRWRDQDDSLSLSHPVFYLQLCPLVLFKCLEVRSEMSLHSQAVGGANALSPSRSVSISPQWQECVPNVKDEPSKNC